jgi:phage-related protein
MSGGYNLGTASGRIEIDGSGVDKGLAVARSAVGAFTASVNSQREQMEQYGKDMTRNAILGATGFAIATKSAASFEKQLSAIQAVSGATESDMRTVAAAALEIGANSAFSATEAARAFEELIKAGIPLEEALNGAAKSTVDLAAAGEIALPRAAEIAANAMNNFNKTGKDMPKIADAIAGAANASAISVEEFAQSLSQVGAVANLTGLSFEDTAVAIAEMGNAGIKGSDAGTSLKTMLMNLIPTMDYQIEKFEEMGLMTYDAADAMKALAQLGITPMSDSLYDVRAAISDYLEETQGIKDDTKEMGKAVDDFLMKNAGMQNAFFDTAGNVKSLAEIQEILQESTKNMTKEQKLSSLETLFGADAIRAAAVMADEGAEGYNKLAAAMGKVTATEVADMRMDNLSGDIEALRGAWETLTIRLGQVFMPVIREVVQAVTKLVQFFADATEFGTEMMAKWLVFKTIGMGVSGVLITLAAQFGGLLAVLIGIKTAFGFVDSAKMAFAVLANGGGIVKAMSVLFTETIRGSILFRTAFKALEVVFVRFLGFGAIGAVFAGIGPALAAGVGPMAVAAATLRGLGGAIMLVVGRFVTLLTGVNRVAGVFSILGGPIGLAIRIILGLVTAGKLLYGTWEPFRNLVDGIVAAIQGGFVAAVQGAQDAVAGLVAGFQGATGSGDSIGATFTNIGAAIRPVVDWLVELYHGVVANLVPAFNTMLSTIQSSVGPALEQLGQVVSTTLWPALQQLGAVIVEQLWPAIVQIAEALWPFIQAAGVVAGVIVGVLFFALVKIAEFIFGQIIPSLMQLAGPVIAFLIGAFGNLIGMIAMFITPIVWLATFIFGTIIPGILQFGAAILNFLVAAFVFLVQVIQNVINWFIQLPAAIETINSTVNGFFSAIGQSIMDAFNGAVAWVTNVFAIIGAVIKTWIDAVVADFMAFVNFWRPVFEPLIAIHNAVWNLIFTIINGVVGLIIALWNFFIGLIINTYLAWSTYMTGEWNRFWEAFRIVVETVVNWVVERWNTFWAVVSAVFAAFGAVISAQWNALWSGLMQFLQPVIDWFNNTIGAWWNSMFQQTSSGGNSISDYINGMWALVQGLFQRAVAIIQAVVAGWMAYIQGRINEGMNFIRSVIDGAWNGVRGIWQGAVNWLNEITNGGFSRMVEIVRIAINMIPGAIQGGWNTALGILRGIPGAIEGIFSGAVNWLGGVGHQIIEGLLSGLRAAAGNVESFFRGLTDMIPEWKGPYKRDKVLLEPAGQAIMKSLSNGFEDEIGDFYKMLDAMNVDIPLALSATLDPEIPRLEGKLRGVPTNSTNFVQEAAKISMNPSYDVTVLLGDKDITDIVDLRVDEHFEETASLIGTGVLD